MGPAPKGWVGGRRFGASSLEYEGQGVENGRSTGSRTPAQNYMPGPHPSHPIPSNPTATSATSRSTFSTYSPGFALRSRPPCDM